MSGLVRRLRLGLVWMVVGVTGCVMLLWYVCKWAMCPDDEIE